MNAIKSVLNQRLDKKYYEIIVIKNFRDKNIDDFIKDKKIKEILIEGTMGEFLYKGISEANGEVISFLDDDDLFLENKLDIVYKEFKKDNNVVYYHNLCVSINKNGKTTNIKSLNTVDFNMSSISIRKSILKINKAERMNISQDTLMYLYALESGKKIIKGKEKLTYYMFHNSTSNIVSNNFEEYRELIITQSNLYLDNFILFNNLFYSKKTIDYLNSRITSIQILKYVYGANETPSKLINYILHSTSIRNFMYRFAFSLIYPLLKAYPKFRKYIGNKMWNIYQKSFNEVI